MSAPVGFASGCFTATDYDAALAATLRHGGDAFELGCYQTAWLDRAAAWARGPGPGRVARVTVHTPRFSRREEARVAGVLGALGLPLILHADRIHDHGAWRGLGSAVLVENIAEPGAFGSTPDTLDEVFAALPAARFCLDVSHAFGAGGAALADELAWRYRDRIEQLHVGCTGVPERPVERLPDDEELVRAAFERAGRDVPVIIERPFHGGAVESVAVEIAAVRRGTATGARTGAPS